MSKYIKLTQEHLEECKNEFLLAIQSGKFPDGKVSFTKTLGTIERKATIYFSELAWLKMQTLVREFSSEVAWHGLAERGSDPSKDEYFITDIFVYPQEVSGTRVTTDQAGYQMWLMEHDEDVFNRIRMQGHSHVNMGVTPSVVDTSLYERILDQLDDSMFYIFMIWNKSKNKTIKIYDLEKNVLFETADVDIAIIDDGTGVETFLKNAKEMVKQKVYSNNTGYSYATPQQRQQTPAYSGSYTQPSAYTKKDEPAPSKVAGSGAKTPVSVNVKGKKKRKGSRKNRHNQGVKNVGSVKRGTEDIYDYDSEEAMFNDYCY